MLFNPMKMNGFTTYVMNSSEVADNIITVFKSAVIDGMEGQDALNYAVSYLKVKPSDLTEYDKERINREVNAFY